MTRWDSLFGLLSLLILWACIAACCSCTNASEDCERVRSVINTKAVLCDAHFEVWGDCDAANYVDGDADACVSAVKASACDMLRQVVEEKCLALFDHGGL